jgi:HD domain
MPSLRALFAGPRRPLPAVEPESFPAADALLEMSSALVFGLEALDGEMDLSGHAQRVAALADRMAAAQGVAEPLRAALWQASLLHEVGMIGVPRELLNAGRPLTTGELERVHAQAEFGAAVARATCGELPAAVIRHQYDDEATLRQRLGEGSDAYTLTLLLRAADVADVVSRGRPGSASAEALRLLRPEAVGAYPDPATAEAWVEATAA